ncbi:MAG: hypothetical protein KC619_18525 [Myxococcales bacterium]|nr:hypothetical protein [Myxococcales bacterium]
MRPWVKRLLIAAIVAPLLVGAGWMGVGYAVTLFANGALAEHGMECDPIDVGFALDLSRATLGPTRCDFESGGIRELRLTGGGFADLDDEQRVTHVEASGIELDLSQDPPRDVAQALVERGEVPPQARDAMATLRELAMRDDVPSFAVRRVLLRRRSRFVTLRRVSMRREGEALVIRVDALAPPPVGSGRFVVEGRMMDLAIHATASSVRIEGRLEIDATLGRREIHEAVPFAMTGRALDGDAPEYEAEIELSEGLQHMRDRHQQRVAEEAAAAAAPPEPPMGDRIHAMAEALREMATSMEEPPPVNTP